MLKAEELESLVRVSCGSPHSLLGMHPLGDGSGVVGRALVPGAVTVDMVPVHDRSAPVIPLRRVGETDVFEGVTRKEHREEEKVPKRKEGERKRMCVCAG